MKEFTEFNMTGKHYLLTTSLPELSYALKVQVTVGLNISSIT
jgi:hypothetical protein